MQRKPKLMIIGANEYQNKLVKKAGEQGYETHVFAWEEGAVAKVNADHFYPISITDQTSILEIGRKIKPQGVISIGSDLAMPTVNSIAKTLGCVCNSERCTQLTTHKYEMRKALQSKGCPCPKFQWVSSFDEVDLQRMSFPLIVKPADRSGSRGIYLAQDKTTLRKGIAYALSTSFGVSVLVEEFIEGKEYSVECITQNGQHHFLQVTEKFTTEAPNFIERGHLAPARIPIRLESRIQDVVFKALDALEITQGASHSEVKVQKNGNIGIIEIAARMGGDFIGSDLVYHSTGYDFVNNVIKIAVDESIEHPKIVQRQSVFVGFIFDHDDLKNYMSLKSRYFDQLIEDHIENEFRVVSDSSSRNGYFLFKIKDESMLNDIIDGMKLDKTKGDRP